MIRRRDNPNIIITQTAHGWLAGQFAMHWGNEAFRFPPLAQDLILAATVHDQGWSNWEQKPELDECQRPIDFLDMPVVTHMELWRQSIRRLATQNYYAALLVSMHARFLVEVRLARDSDTERDLALLKSFSIEQQTWEEETIHRLEVDPYFADGCLFHNLEANMRLLQIFDWLSLLLCMNKLGQSTIVDVPARSPNERVEIRLMPVSEWAFTVKPWPFNRPEFEVCVQTRQLPETTFESNVALQAAWREASIMPMIFKVVEEIDTSLRHSR